MLHLYSLQNTTKNNKISKTDKKELSLLIIGELNAGKTTLVNLLKHIYENFGIKESIIINSDKRITSTLGVKISTNILINEISITTIEVGGQDSYVAFWKNLVAKCDVIVYVIDSIILNNKNKKISVDNLKRFNYMLKLNNTYNKPLLILLNKIDLYNNVFIEEEVMNAYKIDETRNKILENQYKIIRISALKGDGISNVLEYLSNICLIFQNH